MSQSNLQRQEACVSTENDQQTTLTTYADTCVNGTEHCAGVDGLSTADNDDYPQFEARFVCFDCFLDECAAEDDQ